MSSFIVSEECMQNIIYNLFWNHEFKSRNSILKRNGYDSVEDFDRLAVGLYQMNLRATGYRYNEKMEKDLSEFKWDDVKLNKFQALKSMQCLRYQCSEGRIRNEESYILLNNALLSMTIYDIEDKGDKK